MRPALRPAKLRTERAAHALASLSDLFARNRPDLPVEVTVDRASVEQGSPVAPRVNFEAIQNLMGYEARVVYGECLYNVRTALDYLAYNLVWLDTGSPFDYSQFPIVSDRERWASTCKSAIPGVSVAHLEQLKRFQPFDGCEWTKGLHDLARKDRHRFVVEFANEVVFTTNGDFRSFKAHPNDADRLIVPVDDVELKLTLPSGDDALLAMRTYVIESGKLLMSFQEDFGEHDLLSIDE